MVCKKKEAFVVYGPEAKDNNYYNNNENFRPTRRRRCLIIITFSKFEEGKKHYTLGSSFYSTLYHL